MSVNRGHWLHHVKQVIRSRHYTWLPEGLGGESVDEAMTWLTTDVMHVCQLAGIPFDDVLARARQRFDQEEGQLPHPDTSSDASPRTRPVPDESSDAIVAVYTTDDVYDAEITRGLLQNEGIECRLDGQTQGGFTELVNVRVLIHERDVARARELLGSHGH